MEVKEEKLMEEEEKQRVPEKTIPVFTVLKNGAILKNIFVVNSRDFSSPERNGDDDDDKVEEILVIGRHPDCDIFLTHPSISSFHLEIRSISSLQKLFVTDLSSVHGTWVRDLRVEPHACVEVKEGDTIRIGGSTRIYRLHWIPLSRAYDSENPFVSPLDASTAIEQEEESSMIEAENLEVAQYQSLVNTASADDGDLHLDVTSEGTGSLVPSEDEDAYVTTREMSLPLASPSVLTLARDSVKMQKLQFDGDLQTSTKWGLDVVEAAEDKPSSSCSHSKQQSGGYVEELGCSELFVAAEADECDVRGDGGLYLNVMAERIGSAVSNEDEQYLAAKESSSHRKQALSGKSISPTIHHDAENLEPEIFTPDKENLTPSSHMLKRLRDVGEIKDTKGSSSKVTRKPFFDIHLEENVMAEQELHNMSNKSKVKHEPVAPKKKAERAPFQLLLEKSSSQSQSYTEASSTALARNNVSRGIRSSSVVSDNKLPKHLQQKVATKLESELRSPESSSSTCLKSLLIEKEMKIQQMESEMKELKRQRDIAQCKLDLERKAKELKGSNECEPISQGTPVSRQANSFNLKRIERMFMNAVEEFISNIESYVTGLKEHVAKLQFQKQLLFGQVSELEATETGAASESNTNDESQMDWPLCFEEQRKQIIMLWHLCHISIIHRTQFYMLFKGEPADQIYMEVELRRLTWLEQHLAELGNASPAFPSNASPAFPSNASPALLGDKPTSCVSLVCRIRALKQEREYLEKRVNTKLEVEEREMLYLKWDVPPVGKQRRHQFINKLWTDPHNIQNVKESAAIVAKLVGFCDPGAGEKIRKEMFELNFASPSDKKMGWNFISNLLHL